jgi:hypothetical protein
MCWIIYTVRSANLKLKYKLGTRGPSLDKNHISSINNTYCHLNINLFVRISVEMMIKAIFCHVHLNAFDAAHNSVKQIYITLKYFILIITTLFYM